MMPQLECIRLDLVRLLWHTLGDAFPIAARQKHCGSRTLTLVRVQVVMAGTADGAVVIMERDQEGSMKRGRTFRLPQVHNRA